MRSDDDSRWTGASMGWQGLGRFGDHQRYRARILDFGISPETFHAVNVKGAEILCQAMAEHDIDKVCFFSTVAVYGDAQAPLDESTPPQPNSPYGKTKLAAETVFRSWVDENAERHCLVIRPTVTFGPNNFANMLLKLTSRYTFSSVSRIWEGV